MYFDDTVEPSKMDINESVQVCLLIMNARMAFVVGNRRCLQFVREGCPYRGVLLYTTHLGRSS